MGDVGGPGDNYGSSFDLGHHSIDMSPPAQPSQPQPTFGPTVEQPVAPPPISGGTLVVMRDGNTVIAADPDRDHVYVVDIKSKAVRADIALMAGDEPGRVVEDGVGHVHVALRRGGAIVTIDPSTGVILARQSVCAAPRGLAYDGNHDQIIVACSGGSLITLAATGGAPLKTLSVGRDLRDVVLDGGAIYVTRFRKAELIHVAADGSQSAIRPPDFRSKIVRQGAVFSPSVAWRTVALASGGLAMVHQRAAVGGVDTGSGGYGSGGDKCGSGIVHGAITLFGVTGGVLSAGSGAALPAAVLPVDIAVAPDGAEVSIVAAGNALTPTLPSVITIPRGQVTGDCLPVGQPSPVTGQATALAYVSSHTLVVQTREPAELVLLDTSTGMLSTRIGLSSALRADTGHYIFHVNSGGGLACASCHAEGGDDALTWTFSGIGPRRTQTIRGGALGTGPFHWDGDEKDLPALMHDVFVGRMTGPSLDGPQLGALAHWVDSLRAVPQEPGVDMAAVARGKTLFEDSKNVGCTSCHGGAALTNHGIVDVGTGGRFKVPSLVGVAWRAPFLHDGRATSLTDRFAPANGGDLHGLTSQLSSSGIADLVAFLETL